MIDRTIAWSVSNRWLVVAASLALAAGGAWAMRHTPLDAIPDLSDVQVIIRTEWPGRSPDLIEDQITYPIVTALVPTPRSAVGPGLHRFRRVVGLRDLRGRHRRALGAEPRSRVSAGSSRPRCRTASRRRLDPRRPESAGCSNTRSSTKAEGTRSTSCAAFRIGSCATAWQAFPVSWKWRASAASSSSIRSTWTRVACRHTTCRSGRWSRRFAPATATPEEACSSSPAASTWCALAGT